MSARQRVVMPASWWESVAVALAASGRDVSTEPLTEREQLVVARCWAAPLVGAQQCASEVMKANEA